MYCFLPCYDHLIMIKYMTDNAIKEGFILAHISEGGGIVEKSWWKDSRSQESCVLVLSLHTQSSHSFRFILFCYVCGVSVCLCVYMHVDTHSSQKRVSYLEFSS